MSNTIEEAAEKYVNAYYVDSPGYQKRRVRLGFIAGAKWQSEQPIKPVEQYHNCLCGGEVYVYRDMLKCKGCGATYDIPKSKPVEDKIQMAIDWCDVRIKNHRSMEHALSEIGFATFEVYKKFKSYLQSIQ